eukprot:scaffold3208_cov107-Cylindrotheca_fusiformis.AAC.8
MEEKLATGLTVVGAIFGLTGAYLAVTYGFSVVANPLKVVFADPIPGTIQQASPLSTDPTK